MAELNSASRPEGLARMILSICLSAFVLPAAFFGSAIATPELGSHSAKADLAITVLFIAVPFHTLMRLAPTTNSANRH